MAARQKKTEKKRAEQKSMPVPTARWAIDAIEAMSDGLIVHTMDGKIAFVNPAFEKMADYEKSDLVGTNVADVAAKIFNPEDLKKAMGAIKNALEGKFSVPILLTFLSKKGREVIVTFTASFIQDAKGKPSIIIVVFKDITEIKRSQEALNASLDEKEVLLKEIHHRVKNNMQIIYSLLSLQSRHIKDKKVLNMFKESQDRVRSMALLHEKLYQSRDLTRVEFGDYIRKLVSGLFHSYGVHSDSLTINIDVADVYLDINTAIPCGLIINELVSNSLKHAFPKGKVQSERGYTEGKILIRFSSDNSKLTLIVRDNGIGFPKDLDFRSTRSLGLQIVNTLVEQLEGSITLRRKDGTSFKIEFTR